MNTNDDTSLPPDRSSVSTELRHDTKPKLHTMTSRELVDRMNESTMDVHRALEHAAVAIARLIDAAEPGFSRGGRLIYIGAGTSGRLGVLDASEIPPTFQLPDGRVIGIIAGGDASLRKSSESREDEPDGVVDELTQLDLSADDTLIGIAAGGTTPYVLGGLAWSRGLPSPPLTSLICCSMPPTQDAIDHLIHLPTGPEVVTGSTRMKAGTATKLALNTLSTGLMIRTGRVYQDLMVDLRATNDKLRDRAARIVIELTGLTRPDAFALLKRANERVKTAVLMHQLSIEPDEAERRLDRADGRLDVALGETTPNFMTKTTGEHE